MKRVRITAKPRQKDDYIAITSAKAPRLILDGTVLRGFSYEKEAGRSKALTEVEIPAWVDIIENYAFRGLDLLQHVCFGKTPFKLGGGVFSNCLSLKTAVLAEGTDRVSMGTFSGCTSLQKVTLPGTITRINMEAFKNCTALEAVVFPQGLETIEMAAFRGCRSLTELWLPDGLKELWDDAFGNCTGLKQVHLPDSLQEIGAFAFQNCAALEEIVIPEGVKRLPQGVFAGCKNLRRVVLPQSLERASAYAFYKCDSLETVEHPDPGKFEKALQDTPFWQKGHPGAPGKSRLPMELLEHIAGEISGNMLSAMGYHWFETEREYRIFLTDQPGVVEVHSRYADEKIPSQWHDDCFLMTEDLEPISEVQPAKCGSAEGEGPVEQAEAGGAPCAGTAGKGQVK